MIITVLVSLAVLLRILINPLGNVLQKQLTGKGIHPLVVNFVSYFVLSVFCLFLAVFIHWPTLPPQFWVYSIAGGMTGALGNGFLVKALQYGELSVLGPINSYKPVVGIIGGVILLGEIPGLWGILGILLIVYGSYIVLDTTKERFSFALLKKSDIQYRMLAMILTAIEAVFVKRVILVSSVNIAFISWCCFGAVFSFVLLFVYRVDIKNELMHIDNSILYKFSLLIVCIGMMQFTTNYAFEHMSVGYALSLFQLSSIISVFLGYRVFKEIDLRKKLIGSSIMIVGSILIILLKD